MELYTWESVEKEQLNPKLWRRVISGKNLTVAQIALAQGAEVPTHQHESEQFSCVLSGALKFEVGNQEIVVRAGEVLHLPSNVPHGAKALQETLSLDIFSPIRSDWLSGRDDYLRKG
jgi:quercetin dioxygenase-like cupin family protein